VVEPGGQAAGLSRLAREHIDRVIEFYEHCGTTLGWFSAGYAKLLGRYYRFFIPPEASVLEIGCGSGALLAELPNRDLAGIDPSAAQLEAAKVRLPHANFYRQAGEELQLDRTFDYIIISDTVHEAADVQRIFQSLHRVCTPRTRLVMNFFNSLWRPILSLATLLGFRRRQPPHTNWLSPNDIRNLLDLADWQLIKLESKILLPLAAGRLERLVNGAFSPWLPWFCLSNFAIARPRRREQPVKGPSLSIVVPVQNEAGNIEATLSRLPDFHAQTELLFVEGGSTDGTWQVIQRAAAREHPVRVRALHQSGKGKGNAVREGFAAASGDILMILDGDLTVAPEELPKFYEALAGGYADFANGIRLVYPMEEKAMRFLNLCANKFFSVAFSWLLGQSVKDTLCGTKALTRRDYQRVAAGRAYFGDFDPFGDFDLLFGATKLNLKIADIPIRYRERAYGDTKIHRWRDGVRLLRMLIFAARKIKFV
jgi:SAM-dependent methyltransferase